MVAMSTINMDNSRITLIMRTIPSIQCFDFLFAYFWEFDMGFRNEKLNDGKIELIRVK